MDRLRKSLILLLVAGIPAGAPPFFTASTPDLCFTAGSVTYRLAHGGTADVTVAVDNRADNPAMRVGLVDDVAAADFALTDDAGAAAGNACHTAGALKTVRVVASGQPADMTIAVSRNTAHADFTLYVHSARVNHADAAALFALMRRTEKSAVAQVR
jgi:hypothetical protein